MSNIKFTKIWKDNDFYEVELIVETENIRNIIKTYIVERDIIELSETINNYISHSNNNSSWEIGEKGSDSWPYIKFEFVSIDIHGHVQIDVSMDISSEKETNKYYCCFPLETEIGLLYEFGKNILKLNNAELNYQVELMQV